MLYKCKSTAKCPSVANEGWLSVNSSKNVVTYETSYFGTSIRQKQLYN